MIGAFYDAYNTLGPGFLEHVYSLALERELIARGHRVAREYSAIIIYKGVELTSQRLDMVVDEKLVVELKSTNVLEKTAPRRLFSYLRATNLEVGLLLHFSPQARFFRIVASNRNKAQNPPDSLDPHDPRRPVRGPDWRASSGLCFLAGARPRLPFPHKANICPGASLRSNKRSCDHFAARGVWVDVNMRLSSVSATALLSSLLLAACGDSSGPTTSDVTLALSAGNNQAGEAGQPLTEPLAVVVRRASDNAPVSGVTVSWSVVAGGGSVSPAQSTSNASGVASAVRSLGPAAGAQTTRALAGTSQLVFQSTARVQGAVSIANRTTGTLTDTTLGTNAQPLVVFVSDENDAPVAGVTVQWSASGGGSVSATSVPTNAAGESSVQYTFGPTAGAHGAQASVTGLVGSPVAITLTGTAGNATTLEKSAGDGTTAAPGSQVVYTVVTKDARGNARGGVTIDWAVGTGGGSVTPAQSVTGTDGTAQATRTLGATPGAQTTTATAAALAGAPQVTFTTTASAVVQVSNNLFTPSSVTIAAGANVTWTWQAGSDLHNVTFNSVAGAPTHISDRNTGSESRTFSTAGSFPYHCTIHGLSMSGTVTVNP